MVANTGNKEQQTPCILKQCAHSKARNWIQCASCQGWWHCVCANVTHAIQRLHLIHLSLFVLHVKCSLSTITCDSWKHFFDYHILRVCFARSCNLMSVWFYNVRIKLSETLWEINAHIDTDAMLFPCSQLFTELQIKIRRSAHARSPQGSTGNIYRNFMCGRWMDLHVHLLPRKCTEAPRNLLRNHIITYHTCTKISV